VSELLTSASQMLQYSNCSPVLNFSVSCGFLQTKLLRQLPKEQQIDFPTFVPSFFKGKVEGMLLSDPSCDCSKPTSLLVDAFNTFLFLFASAASLDW
jgi:hypothetical protein